MVKNVFIGHYNARVSFSVACSFPSSYPRLSVCNPSVVRVNNGKHTVEALITCKQLCDPPRGDNIITVLLLNAEHLFKKQTKKKNNQSKTKKNPISLPSGLVVRSTVINLFVFVLVGGKLSDRL